MKLMTKTTKTINSELSVSAVLPYYHFTAELIEANAARA